MRFGAKQAFLKQVTFIHVGLEFSRQAAKHTARSNIVWANRSFYKPYVSQFGPMQQILQHFPAQALAACPLMNSYLPDK